MSLDAIKAITVAEETARKQKNEAQQNAAKIIADARVAGETTVSKTRENAAAEAEALMTNAESNAYAYADELRDNTFNKCAAMRAKAELRLDTAAAYIVRRVVEG